MVAIYLGGVLVIIFCFIGIFYLTKSEQVVMLVYKMNMCDKEINEFLDIKESLIIRILNIIRRE